MKGEIIMSEKRELNLKELEQVNGGAQKERKERKEHVYVVSNDMEKLYDKIHWRKYQREHKNEAPVIDRLTIKLY